MLNLWSSLCSRSQRSARLQPSWSITRPSPADAERLHPPAAPQQQSEIWEAHVVVALAKDCLSTGNRGGVLPQNHRQCSYRKTLMWHVQIQLNAQLGIVNTELRRMLSVGPLLQCNCWYTPASGQFQFRVEWNAYVGLGWKLSSSMLMFRTPPGVTIAHMANCWHISIMHSGYVHRSNLKVLWWKRYVDRDFYFIDRVSTWPSWATLMKANKLETELSVGWILLM